MSEYKGKIILGAVLAVVVAVGLAGATVMLAPQLGTSSTQQSSSSTNQVSSTTVTSPQQVGTTRSTLGSQGGQSVLLVQLTDPPVVPAGTTDLNLTYSAIMLLVAEPSVTTETSTSVVTGSSSTSTVTSTFTQTQTGVVTTESVKITPNGVSASVNLLRLQNISETLASANLPNGTVIYSVTFVVSSLNITINGVNSPVTLASGGRSLLVTLAKPSTLQGTNAMLVDLTPTVVNTTSGYQLIPSAVGIIKPQSEITGQQQQVGHEQNLTDQDRQDLHNAMGQVSASLVAMSVSGNTTTISVKVNNTGSSTIGLTAIGIHGNFTAKNSGCTTTSSSSSSSTTREYDIGGFGHQLGCYMPFVMNDFVFFPNSSVTTTSSGCGTGTIGLFNLNAMDNQQGSFQQDGGNHVQIAAGQCVVLTFSGVITFGFNGAVIVPSTEAGQQYIVQVIATNSAEMMLNCTLPASSTSCAPIHSNFGDSGGQ